MHAADEPGPRSDPAAQDHRPPPRAVAAGGTRRRRRWSAPAGRTGLGLVAAAATVALALAGCQPGAGSGVTGGAGPVPTTSGAAQAPTTPPASPAAGSPSASPPTGSPSSPATTPPPPGPAGTVPPAGDPAASSGRKGISVWGFGGLRTALQDVGASWYYNWAATPNGVPAPAGTRFVPMIWGAQSVNPTTLGQASAAGDTLLGFNEPDLAGQANMTVDQALDLWPQLQATGKRLGAPAVASGGADPGGWLDRFMAGAKQRGYRVDFIPLHWYGGDFDTTRAVGQLQSYLRAVYNRYHLPIWLTEYALMDFSGGTARAPSTQQQADFVTASTTMLESLPFVNRYAWFSLPATPGSLTGLYDEQGNPNAAGLAYRRAGSTS